MLSNVFTKPTKKGLAVAALLTIFIFLLDTIGLVFTKFLLWPMALACVTFFMTGAQLKCIKNVLLGGFAGLVLSVARLWAVDQLTPFIGEMPSRLLFLFLALTIIIVGGNFCKLLLNDITFVFLVVACLNPPSLFENFWSLVLVLFVGGFAITLGSYAVVTTVGKRFEKKETT